jgi:hypothetical protein
MSGPVTSVAWVVRAAFTSFPFPEPPGSLTDDYLDQRLALTRFIADLGLKQAPARCRNLPRRREP